MAEQDFNLALVNDQGPSTPAPQDQQTSAPSVGVTGPNRPPQSPQTGRGSGRGQKTPRGRANAQRTPPPGRDSRRSSAGSEGRSQALLKPGRRAGLIVNLKESFGFVRVHGVPENLFFHVTEVMPQPCEDGQSRLDLQKTLFPGDHVEFDVVRSDRDQGTFVAKQVKKVDPPPASPAAANGQAPRIPVREDVLAQPEQEAGPGQSKALEWRTARPAGQAPSPVQSASMARELGIVASIKNNFGFIRCAEREGRLFFRLGAHAKVQPEQFRVRLEVSFRVTMDEGTRKPVACDLEVLDSGTVAQAMQHTEGVEGVVMQPPGARPQEEGDGIVNYTGPDDRPCSVPYDSFVVAGEEVPGVNDRVRFDVAVHVASGTSFATRMQVLEKVAPKREYGKVSIIKNNFGFIKPCELVRKAPPGSAVFEVIEDEVQQGVVAERLVLGKGGITFSAGVLEYGPPGCTYRLVFTAEDLQEVGVNPLAGAPVKFQVAVRPQVAASAAKGGGSLAVHAGKRATKVQAVPLAGTVANVKPHFGFLDFKEGEETRHIFFHSTAVEGGVTLRVGDEASFIILDRGKLKELVACKIQRTKEAPPAADKEAAKPVKELVAETNPNRMVFVGAAKPGAGKGNQVVRLARGPDGTKGFAPGRGKNLPTDLLPASPGAPTQPVLLRRSPAPGSRASRKGASNDAAKTNDNPKAKGLASAAAAGASQAVEGQADQSDAGCRD
ncbi:hypothetical protein WJX84_003816 [Apatococcus fuscideae]|uniref:Cold-shock domain-containing protein n=1 Tax=Apatococcus fuscideae TaxID=2026836 RepID=A0AAW1T3W8_9CHLO